MVKKLTKRQRILKAAKKAGHTRSLLVKVANDNDILKDHEKGFSVLDISIARRIHPSRVRNIIHRAEVANETQSHGRTDFEAIFTVPVLIERAIDLASQRLGNFLIESGALPPKSSVRAFVAEVRKRIADAFDEAANLGRIPPPLPKAPGIRKGPFGRELT